MTKNEIKEYIKCGLAITVLYTFFYMVGVGCPIKFMTGISTAGCGMTRAWIRFIHFDLKGAFYYHPLFLLPIIYSLLFLFKSRINTKILRISVYIGIALFITVYVIRLLNPANTVININIKSGLIYKFIEFLHDGGV